MANNSNFDPTNGSRLATDRFDFQAHVNGSNFRHQAGSVDLFPTVVINSQTCTTVQSAIQAVANLPVFTVPDATTGSKGIIQLSGDLSGTATAPSVVKIRGRSLSNAIPTDGQVLTYDAGTSSWIPETTAGGNVAWIDSSGNLLPVRTNTQVQPSLRAFDDGVRIQIAGNTFLDPRDAPYYYRATGPHGVSSTATCIAGNPTVSFANASNFLAHDGVCIIGAGNPVTFTTPAAPILNVSNAGTGSSEMEYKIVACSGKLGLSIASSAAICSGVDSTLAPRARCYFTSCQAAITTGNLPGYSGGSIPNVPLIVDTWIGSISSNRILVWQQTNPVENGVYVFTTSNGIAGTLTRDATWTTTRPGSGGGGAIFGDGFVMRRGNVYASKRFRINTNITTIGVDPIGIIPMPYVNVSPNYTLADVATTANITLSGAQTIDGYTGIAGTSIVLVKNQNNAAENGLYTMQNSGWTRATGFTTNTQLLQGMVVMVKFGNTQPIFVANAANGAMYVQTNQPTTINSDPINYAAETVVFWLFYGRQNATGNFQFLGATNANPHWITQSQPVDPSFRDYSKNGLIGSSYIPTSTPPVALRPDYLHTRISAISGNSVTLVSPPISSCTAQWVRQTNSLALEDAMNSFSAVGQSQGGTIVLPVGLGYLTENLTVRKCIHFTSPGDGGELLQANGTQLFFAPGFGVRVIDSQHPIDQVTPSQNSSGTLSTFDRITVVGEEQTLPAGCGIHSTLDGPSDVFGRGVEHGVGFVIQTTAHASGVSVIGAAGAAFFICGTDLSGNSNANNSDFSRCRAGSPTGRGYWIQGANANTCCIYMPEMSNSGGFGYYNAAFLGSSLIRPHCEGSDGASYYMTTGSIDRAYCEDAGGVVYLLGGDFTATLCGMDEIHPISYNNFATWRLPGGAISSFNVQQANGIQNITIGDPILGQTLRSIVSQKTYPGLKSNFIETIIPVIADGAITHYWSTSSLVAYRIMGANPTGSGIMRFIRGVELSNNTEATFRRWLEAWGSGNATSPPNGWFQIGDFRPDITMGGNLNRFAYCINDEFGVGSAFVNGNGQRVGDKITVGGTTTYVVQSVVDGTTSGGVNITTGITNQESGALQNAGTPSDPGSHNTVDSGTLRLYRLKNNGPGTGTSNRVQVFAFPSPPSTAITTNPGVPQSVGVSNSYTIKGASNLTADRGLYFNNSTALPGDQHLHVRTYGGDFREIIYDYDSTTIRAILPAGTTSSAKLQFDGYNWQVLSAPSTVFRRFKSLADLIVEPLSMLAQGNIACIDDNSEWGLTASSSAADITGLLIQVPTGAATPGQRWVRRNAIIDLKLPIDFTAANNTVLFTVPTGFRLYVMDSFWEITVTPAGGTAPTVGLSSSSTRANTPGDILGGVSGDSATNLTSSNLFYGTKGTKIGSANTLVLLPGDTIIFNQINDAFTSGSGAAHIRIQALT